MLQVGLPWVSNPELVAAVSNAGGLGVLHSTAGADSDSDLVVNLKANIRRTHGLTRKPFAVAFYLPSPQIEALIEGAVHEGVHIAVTYGGSPALYTGTLKDHRMMVLHQLATVRHARWAEAQGIDIVIAEGFEGGGLRGADKVSTMVLVPPKVCSGSIPVIASGVIVDTRGYVAAIALGAYGVQMGSRFVAAIDSGTVILGGDRWPFRVLRNCVALRLKDEGLHEGLQGAKTDSSAWEAKFGAAKARAAMMGGDLESGIVYTGVGSGLISEILTVHQVLEELEQGTQTLARKLS